MSLLILALVQHGTASPKDRSEREIDLQSIQGAGLRLKEEGPIADFTWWLPPGASQYVFPITGGVVVQEEAVHSSGWLRDRSPWELKELPVIGARYGERYLTVIVPWPHYVELVVSNRVGIRFSFPAGRESATPVEIVARWTGREPIEVPRTFRRWRSEDDNLGAIPARISLREKSRALSSVSALPGAAHFYLWGPALFSRHDVEKRKWLALAKFLLAAPADSRAGHLVRTFSNQQRSALAELANAPSPMDYLTAEVAAGIQQALQSETLSGRSPAKKSPVATWTRNRAEVADILKEYVNPPGTWGDGPSITMVEQLHAAGVEKAVLLLSDLYPKTPRPDVAERARQLGYVYGPYDSYHSVHDPNAAPDRTWSTAQFDENAYIQGRVLNRDGTGHSGFKGRGFHFAPSAAWPYVQQRVGGLLEETKYSTWFIDCDATAECFDDYHPQHSGTQVSDIEIRRKRLRWLAKEKGLVVGSEGGSILFSDVIHFGHGVQTPFIGHLDKGFRDPASPHFLGKYWPSDSPDAFLKTTTTPVSLRSPYFDPAVRFPMYQTAIGDELIATHHWSFDSLKFSDVAATRQLMEILYMTPPMYNLNRSTWPMRKDKIVRHVQFWSPIHAHLATAPLTNFEYLSKDLLVQRTTFAVGDNKKVTITANFANSPQDGYPPVSVTMAGLAGLRETVYRAVP